MKLKGAVIMIGSLYWEDDTNCINLSDQKKLALSRKNWRNEKLLMDQSEIINLPIRYGRISSTRYCTYTMLFSNLVSNPGQGYCVPYKNEIDVTDNFNQIYFQALELANVEGISKSGENKLFKKWGCVGLKLNPKLQIENPKVAEKLTAFWSSYFRIFDQNLFRINEYEESSVTSNGLLNFDIEDKLTDIDYFLATPVSPNIKHYPHGKEIAESMLKTREEYFTYFVENYNNKIRTFDDKDIIEFLPPNISNLLIP
jgi:hypothetical protein